MIFTISENESFKVTNILPYTVAGNVIVFVFKNNFLSLRTYREFTKENMHIFCRYYNME